MTHCRPALGINALGYHMATRRKLGDRRSGADRRSEFERRSKGERRQTTVTPAIERRVLLIRRNGERRVAQRRVLAVRRLVPERRRISGASVLA